MILKCGERGVLFKERLLTFQNSVWENEILPQDWTMRTAANIHKK
jgi:hypothetical protein